MDKVKIIIILSRNSLSMRYFDSSVSDGYPVPFGMDRESVVPLSICCEGTNFSIGKYALTEASKGNRNAFGNFFDAIEELDSFDYCGRRENIRSLLFLALRYNIDLLMETRFRKDLESMIQDLQIVLVFHSDISQSERQMIHSQFLANNFDDVVMLPYEKLLVESLKSADAKNVFLKNDGKNLFANICNENGDSVLLKNIGEFGKNPRVEFATQLLWDSLGASCYYFRKENEENLLEAFVVDFLRSGANEINDCITLSDGNQYQCFLSLHEINNYQPSRGVVSSELERFLKQNGLEPKDCNLILQCGISNDYFLGLLEKSGFRSIVNDGENELNEVFKLALQAGKVLEDLKNSKPQLPENLRRKIVMSRREIDVLIKNKNISKAKDIIMDNLKQLHSFENYEFDEEFAEKLSMCEPKDEPVSETKSKTPEPQPKKKPVVENVRLNKREVKERVLDIKNLIKRGEDAKALSELRKMKEYEADVPEIAELIRQLDKPKVDLSDAQISSIKREIKELTASRKIDEAISLAKSTISQMDKTDKRINDLQQLIDKAITKRNI